MASGPPASYTVAPLQLSASRHDGMGQRGAQAFLWAAAIIVASYIFAGPTRYLLLVAHAPTLIYLRDLAALGFVVFAFSLWMGGDRRMFPLVVACYALFLHLLCGVLLLPSVVQPLLG